jgi:hypothetical protein
MNEDLERLAEQIREVYWREYSRFNQKFSPQAKPHGVIETPRWDGGTDGRGVRRQPVWPKIAQYFLDNQLPVERTIRAVFDAVQGSQPPTPDLLKNARVPQIVQEYPDEVLAKLGRQYASDKSQAKVFYHECCEYTQWKPEEITRLTIYTQQVSISAVFRYSLAVTSGNTDLAHRCFEKAFEQYRDYAEAYDQIYGVEVLARLRERLNQLRGGR